MFKFSTDAHISKPVDQVFAYLANVAKQPEWEPNILACQLDGAGPIQKGSTATQTVRRKGGEHQVSLTVTEFEPGRRLKFEKQWPFRTAFGWILEPSDGGTHVTYPVELDAKGFFRIALSLMRVFAVFGMRTPIHRDLDNIKKRVEANT
jgi:uncharacterized protein YndB with AHSA1/START domain